MVQIRFSSCLVWVLSASVYLPSSLVWSAQISTSDFRKYPRHDKNWWFWNQEAKEKPETFVDTHQKKGEKEIKLEFKRSVHPITPDAGLPSSLLSKEPLTYHTNRKRWLTGTFGFRGKKNLVKESRKWQIDSQRSGLNILSTAQVIPDSWTLPHKKNEQMDRGGYKTGIPSQTFSAGSRVKAPRKHNIHNKKISVRIHNPNEHRVVMNADNLLFGSAIHAYDKENNLNSVAYRSQQLQRFPEQSMIKYGYHRPLPASGYQQVWNKSDDPIWDRSMTPIDGEIKFNPLKHPYPFHSSNIKWFTTPRHELFKTLEPLKQRAQDDYRLLSSAENVNGTFDEIMESKGVAKSKKAKELAEQRHRDHELMPRLYALTQLKNGKKSFKKYKDHYGRFTDSDTNNPIIVPGFKRKHSDGAQAPAPHNEQSILPSYIVTAEECKNPYDEEFIQVSRANRNHSKNVLGVNDFRQVTAGNIPIQVPSPYAFPGGVNISILVPNPPAPSSHETPLSAMTSTSSDKNIKKKKERKNKVKSSEELHTNLMSEPRSFVSTRVNVKKFPYAGAAINPLTGDDERRMVGMNLTHYRPQLKGTMDSIKHPLFNLKTENFSLLSHIKNLTMNQLDWDAPLFGIQTETVKKPADYREDDDDDDEIRMLYDELTPATTTLQSDDKENAVSFSWYRLTDFAPRGFSLQNAWGIGELSTPPNIKRIPGFEFSSGRVKPRKEYDEYLVKHDSRSMNYTSAGNERTFKRSRRDEFRKYDHENGPNTLKQCGISPSIVKHENYNENEQLGRKYHHSEPRDQWDALDEDLKSEINVNNGKDVAWQAKNRKREADYDEHQENDEQGYYRLSVGESSLRNPSNLIMSALRRKSHQPREREYYDDIPEQRIREQMGPTDVVPPTYPK